MPSFRCLSAQRVTGQIPAATLQSSHRLARQYQDTSARTAHDAVAPGARRSWACILSAARRIAADSLPRQLVAPLPPAAALLGCAGGGQRQAERKTGASRPHKTCKNDCVALHNLWGLVPPVSG